MQCCLCKDEEQGDFNPRAKRTDSMFYLTDVTNQKGMSSPSSDLELQPKAPQLVLEVKESPWFPAGKTFKISPSGAKESKREVIDGRTVIGSDPNTCDIVLAEDEDVGRMHCAVEFSGKEKKYFVKDLGEGNGTFMKIEERLVLHNRDTVSFGDTHAVVVMEGSTLKLQVYEGPRAEEEFVFTPSNNTVSFGRVPSCTVQIDDKNLSRSHCFLRYNESQGWVLHDGDGNKRSANGTWIFLEHDMAIIHGMIIRIGKSIFRAVLLDPEAWRS